MASLTSKLRAPWARLLCLRPIVTAGRPPLRSLLSAPIHPASHQPLRHFSAAAAASLQGDKVIRELLAEVEREKQLEREEKRKAGLPLGDEDEEEDYMGVGLLIEKLEKKKVKDSEFLEQYWEPTDSESEDDEEMNKRVEQFEKKHKRHSELLKSFAEAETLDEADKWMAKIEKFEQKYFRLPLEYRVIGDMMNRLKESTGKERFILLQKLNRAVRMMEVKEAYDPNDPANFGLIKQQQVGSPDDIIDHAGFEKQRAMMQGLDDGDDEDFNETKGKDDILLEKLNQIEKKLEQKLAELNHTFGKKGRALEEEIKDLVEERNSLTVSKRMPLYRKGFDVKLINVNRTVKVTKGGRIVKFTALVATGNYHGVVGFAKARGDKARLAIQRAYEKCFQDLHYVERHEGHTIAHAIQAKYGRTKIFLWPGPLRSGMSAATNSVGTVLALAGFSNVKTKVIGSRNPLNVMKALFIALNAIETPKDIQEKFGRTVVESYLLQGESTQAPA